MAEVVGWWGGVHKLSQVKDGGRPSHQDPPPPLAFCLQDQERLDWAGLSLLREMTMHYGKRRQGNLSAMTSKELPTVVPSLGLITTLIPPTPSHHVH